MLQLFCGTWIPIITHKFMKSFGRENCGISLVIRCSTHCYYSLYRVNLEEDGDKAQAPCLVEGGSLQTLIEICAMISAMQITIEVNQIKPRFSFGSSRETYYRVILSRHSLCWKALTVSILDVVGFTLV